MVLLRSSNKVGRKPRVAIGNSKSSGGVKTLRPKSGGRSNADKSHGESRLSTGESRDDKVNGRKATRIAGNDSNDKSGGRKKGDFKTRGGGDEGFKRVMDVRTGQKRKRTYGGPGIVEERRGDGFKNKRPISESRNGSPRLYSDKAEKKVWVGKARESEGASRNPVGHSKFNGSEVHDKKFRSDKPKRVQENGFGNGMLESRDKRKTKLATSKDLNPRTYATEKPRKYVKKSLVTGSDSKDVLLPKKKKRVMRIDPRDVSNKRMDDGIGNSQAKVNSEENINAELSKNAQFRAIVPSPSILSFVEDNLLGRRRDIDFRRAGYNIQLSAPLDNIPFTTCSERERIEVPVFRNKLEFYAAAKTSSSFPPPDLPEIAFAGRSNVGKSSLLNALTRNWGVARTSDKPGLTQTINFFKLGPKMSLVDLPGYGFAYAKEEVKEAWEELVKEYVTTRVGLKRVCVLIDTKWGMKPRDLELIDLMERSQTKYQVVLTKTDTVFPIDVARRAMEIEDSLKANKSAVQPLMMVSSRTGAGMRSLRTVLANIARLVK